MDAWRPFEPSRDEVKRIEAEREANTCNLHDDCAEADRKFRRMHPDGRQMRWGLQRNATHCNDENCEDCFGC